MRSERFLNPIHPGKNAPETDRRDALCHKNPSTISLNSSILPENDWREGENPYQNYYDVTVDGKYLLVFANKQQPDIWMAMVDGIMIHDRTANDKQRKKQGLPNGCPLSQLHSTTILTNSGKKSPSSKRNVGGG